MALYSPAYISISYTSNGCQINTDYENNFSIHHVGSLRGAVRNIANGAYQSCIYIQRFPFFINSFQCLFESLLLQTTGYIDIERNAIKTTVPLNPNGLINLHDYFLIISISDEMLPLDRTGISSNTQTLSQLFIQEKPNYIKLLKNIIFTSFPFSDITAIPLNGIRKNILTFNYELPLNYMYKQYKQGFYLYTIHGIGLPNYGLNLDSAGGNGLLDFEFSSYNSAIASDEALSGSNYGSFQFRTNSSTNAINAKITSWNINTNFYLSGKILQLK